MGLPRRIAVVGLGYVGLPIAVAFGMHDKVIGFDNNQQRIKELQAYHDCTGEVDETTLRHNQVHCTADETELAHCDFFIVTVPTPIDQAKQPNLQALSNASQLLARYLKKGDIVVYESTVYPGVTEDECAPLLEQHSQLICGRDFFVGYSPERINPGDTAHRLHNINKVVSANDPEALQTIAALYRYVVDCEIYQAPSIKTAEMAKVIENTQRDLNIALMNEVALICQRLHIDTSDVLAAARTKWNFLDFKPGLVGGHCIGVDPYYLSYKAEQLGIRPEVIFAGRRINDAMGKYIAEQTIKLLIQADISIKRARVAILGMTFKENCPDVRNSKVIDIITELKSYGIDVMVHDPIADSRASETEYGVTLQPWQAITNVDAIVIAVAHSCFKEYTVEDYAQRLTRSQQIIDVKSMLDRAQFTSHGLRLWRL